MKEPYVEKTVSMCEDTKIALSSASDAYFGNIRKMI